MNPTTLKDKAQAVSKASAAGTSPLDKPHLDALIDLGNTSEAIVALIAAYSDAIDDIAFWAHYASEFHQLKHDLDGTLRKHQARLVTLRVR